MPSKTYIVIVGGFGGNESPTTWHGAVYRGALADSGSFYKKWDGTSEAMKN